MKKLRIVFVIMSFLILIGFVLLGKISGEKFDSAKWKTADMNSEVNWSLRWDMMNSLRNNYELIGMSKKEIISLLGQPIDEFSKNDIFYYSLGMARSGVETGVLIIRFENDRVISYLVRKS